MKVQKCMAVLMAALMLLVMAGCSTDPVDSSDPSSAASTAPTSDPTTGGNPTVPTDPTTGDGNTTTTEGGNTTMGGGNATTPTTPPTTPVKQNQASVTAHGAKGNGTTDDTAAFQAAMAKVENDGSIYIPNGNYAIKKNLTVPAGVVLVFERGATLTISSGITVTIKGYVDAGAYAIFAGSGKIAGGIQGVGYPQWFGAKGDGSADDTAAFQKAVDVLSYVQVPYTVQKYKVGQINLTKAVVLEGAGTNKVELTAMGSASANGKTFVIRSSNVTIKNFKIAGGGTAQGSTVFYVDTSSANLSNLTIENIWCGWTAYFLKDTQSASHTVTKATLKNITTSYHYNSTAIHLTDFTSDILIDEVLANDVEMTANTISKPLIIIENTTKMTIRDLDVAGGFSFNSASYIGQGGDGVVFKNCKNVVGDRFMADYINGYCVKMINCSGFRLNNWVASLYEDGAFYLDNVQNSSFTLLKVNGIQGAETSTHAGTAFKMVNGCSGNTFQNVILQQNLTHAMEVNNSSNNTFINFQFFNNNGSAYQETGSSNHNTLVGAVFRNNAGTQIQQTGSSSVLVGAMVHTTFYERKTGAFTV